VQGLFRIVQSYLDVHIFMLNFQTGKQVVRPLLYSWNRSHRFAFGLEKYGYKEGSRPYALPPQLQRVLEEIPCVVASFDGRVY
jgi:hypothetical protein